MLNAIGNVSLIVFFFMLLDLLSFGASTRWARAGARGALGFVRRGMRLE